MSSERKKLLVICPHPENVAPGQRLKYEQYFDSWRANGYDVTVSSFMTPRFWNMVYQPGRWPEKIAWTLFGYLTRALNLFRLPFYDGVYIFLWVVPFGPPVFERLYLALSRRVIYDIDDLVFTKPKSRHNAFVSVLKSRARITTLMRGSQHVITCTPALDAFARQYNSETTDISSTINTDTYVPANRYANDRPLVLGWSGSHTTAKYLALLTDVLVALGRERAVRLLVIGGEFAAEGLEVTSIPWSEPNEVADLRKIDIGLYPLPDEEWVLGKSGLKALQYMALGIPTVATAIGANFRVIEDGVSGFLVRGNEEWKDRLLRLIDHPELRRKWGARAPRVEQIYSVRANQGTYLRILDTVIRGGRASSQALDPAGVPCSELSR